MGYTHFVFIVEYWLLLVSWLLLVRRIYSEANLLQGLVTNFVFCQGSAEQGPTAKYLTSARLWSLLSPPFECIICGCDWVVMPWHGPTVRPPGRCRPRLATASIVLGATWHELQSESAAICVGLELPKWGPTVNYYFQAWGQLACWGPMLLIIGFVTLWKISGRSQAWVMSGYLYQKTIVNSLGWPAIG